MASGYSAFGSLNSRSTQGMDRTSRARFRTCDISIHDIYSSDRNFYAQEGIAEKAAEIHAVGLLSNLVVADIPAEDGTPYRLISGERRWRALCLLAEEGYKEFETVTCQVRSPANEHEEMIELILANSSREKDIATLIREEQTLKNELQYMREHKLQLNGYDLQSGRLRDIVASIMNLSKTKIAEIEAVANRLVPDFKAELEADKLNFSVAYQLSKLQEGEQRELYEKYREYGELSYKDVLDYAKQKEEERERAQLPGQMKLEDLQELEAPEREQEEILREEIQKEEVADAVEVPAVSQAQIDGDVYLFYKHTMHQNERDAFHKVNCSGQAKLMLLARLSHIGTGGSYQDGYSYRTLGRGWICFGSGDKEHSMTIYQIMNRLKDILERNPMLKITSNKEDIPGNVEQHTENETVKEDCQTEKSTVPVEQCEGVREFLNEKEASILQEMIIKQIDYVRMASKEEPANEERKIRHQLMLEALEFYFYEKYTDYRRKKWHEQD